MLNDNLKINYNCPVCGGNSIKIIYKDTLQNDLPVFGYNFSSETNKSYQIVKCNNCTHHFASPRHKNIYKNYTDVIDYEYLKNKNQYKKTFIKVLQFLIKIKPKGTLLDVGCSTGIFLNEAKKYYMVEGIELSDWARSIAQSKGFKVHNTLLKYFTLNKKYDIITLWGVIEHFEFPEEELSFLVNILKKDGIICLWTGDINSITAKILKSKWWYHQGQHLQMFTKKSLIKLFTDKGFTKVYSDIYPYVMTFKSISKSLERYPLISSIINKFFNSKLLVKKTITLKIPGEMFFIFKKNNS